MDETLSKAARWRENGQRVALATVVATRRSAPRPVGSKLAVSDQGELAGSVSGGCVESDVVLAAQEVLASGEPRLVTYGITDDMALGIGLPCGGEIDVFVEELRDEERPDVLLTVVAGDGAGERLHDPGLEQEARRRGRSHAFPLGGRTVFADARASFATPERIPSADELLVLWPDEALAHVRPDVDTAVLVLAHDDKFDLPLLEAALRSDAFYVGALGSRRNQERRRGLLLGRGVDEDDLDRIAGPAGLDIGADSPAETALSMLAEILAVRAGRAGGRLKQSAHRIHAQPVS